MKARLQKVLAEYGKVALYTYLALSLLAITGFSIAIGLGVAPSSATGTFGVIVAGWAAAKATMPLRILATLALTPLIATLVRRITKRKTPATEEVTGDDDDAVAAESSGDGQANVGK
jgi:hypothetical protein